MMATTTNSAIASPEQEAQMTTSNNSKFQDEFRAGVTAVLRSWSALKTAVTNEWGGPGSKEKATELRGHILSAFEQQQTSTTKSGMDQYELEDNLLLYMEEEFSIVLEDDSEKQLAFTICQMFENSYQKNDFTLCRRMVSLAEHIRQQEEGGGGVSHMAQVIDQDDDDDDSMVDEDDDDHPSNTTMLMDSSVPKPATTTSASSKSTFDEESYITGTLNSSANLLVPVSDEIVQLYADLTNPLFGTKKPTKDIPPPRQLGEERAEPMVDDHENNMMDDDGFITVKPKNNRRR